MNIGYNEIYTTIVNDINLKKDNKKLLSNISSYIDYIDTQQTLNLTNIVLVLNKINNQNNELSSYIQDGKELIKNLEVCEEELKKFYSEFNEYLDVNTKPDDTFSAGVNNVENTKDIIEKFKAFLDDTSKQYELRNYNEIYNNLKKLNTLFKSILNCSTNNDNICDKNNNSSLELESIQEKYWTILNNISDYCKIEIIARIEANNSKALQTEFIILCNIIDITKPKYKYDILKVFTSKAITEISEHYINDNITNWSILFNNLGALSKWISINLNKNMLTKKYVFCKIDSWTETYLYLCLVEISMYTKQKITQNSNSICTPMTINEWKKLYNALDVMQTNLIKCCNSCNDSEITKDKEEFCLTKIMTGYMNIWKNFYAAKLNEVVRKIDNNSENEPLVQIKVNNQAFVVYDSIAALKSIYDLIDSDINTYQIKQMEYDRQNIFKDYVLTYIENKFSYTIKYWIKLMKDSAYIKLTSQLLGYDDIVKYNFNISLTTTKDITELSYILSSYEALEKFVQIDEIKQYKVVTFIILVTCIITGVNKKELSNNLFEVLKAFKTTLNSNTFAFLVDVVNKNIEINNSQC